MKKFLRGLLIFTLVVMLGSLLSFVFLDYPGLKVKMEKDGKNIFEEIFDGAENHGILYTGGALEGEFGEYIQVPTEPFEKLNIQGDNVELRIEKGDTYKIACSGIRGKKSLQQEGDLLQIQQRGQKVSYEITHPHPETLELQGDIRNGEVHLLQSLKEGKLSLNNGGVNIKGATSYPLNVAVDNGEIRLSLDQMDASLSTDVDMGEIRVKGKKLSGIGLERQEDKFGSGRDRVQLSVNNGEIRVD